MLSLGYTEYVAQGGDWGSIIIRMMGRYHQNNLRAVHVNLAVFDFASLFNQPLVLLQSLISWTWWSKTEVQGLKNGFQYATVGNSYYKMHQNRPQTVAYCLADSPVALLGWIYEKLIHWTDDYPWTDDEILTWISIYWFSTAGPGASVRTYFEAHNPSKEFGGLATDKAFWAWTKVPLGITQFPKDVIGIPKVFTQTLGNVVLQNWGKDGGHFAAWERPDVIVNALRTMFGEGGGACGVLGTVDNSEESKKAI
jgi:pimeloyl-ACP methyl ester carboxylesterase